MYKRMLDNLRKEVETPVEPILPAPHKGLVSQRRQEEEKLPDDPLSLMREWHNRIKSSSSKFQQKAVEERLSKEETPKSSFIKGLMADELNSQDKGLVKRPSVFDGEIGNIKDSGDGLGDFSLDVSDAASLVRQKEGFRETPYWDVNAYRVGYGSDTITKPDGRVVRVTPDVRVSREDAERDLERRLGESTSKIVSKVGENKWTSLPDKAKAALISVTYNYGHLPDSVASAVKGGSISSIASAVEDLKHHNSGINKKRRLQEASLIRMSGV